MENTMENVMEQFWKNKYTEMDSERYKYVMLASRMTGHFGGLAKFDSSIPKQARVRMLECLVELWNELDPDSKLTQEWIESWKKEIQALSA
jgi:hypothetical protein